MVFLGLTNSNMKGRPMPSIRTSTSSRPDELKLKLSNTMDGFTSAIKSSSTEDSAFRSPSTSHGEFYWTTMMRVPRKPSDVTKDWVKGIFESAVTDVAHVEITSFEAEGHQESGYLSSIFRINAQVTKSGGTSEELRTFVKIMPEDDVHMSLIGTNFMDVTEVDSYRVLFPDLEAFAKSFAKTNQTNILELVPRMLAGGYLKDDPKDRAFFLMLTNESPTFQMRPFNEGLSLAELCSAMAGLAQVHSWSYCMKKTQKIPSFEQQYPFLNNFFQNFESDPELIDFVNVNMDLVEKDLKGSSIEDCAPMVHQIRKGLGRKYSKLMFNTDDFLIHGDIWGNNCLFDTQGNVKIVDWQFTTNANPFLDIGTMAFISMSPEATEKHLDEILGAYYQAFEVTARQCEVEMPWSQDQFHAQALEQGLLLCFFWCSTSYELAHKYPKLKERVHWVIRKSTSLSPKSYDWDRRMLHKVIVLVCSVALTWACEPLSLSNGKFECDEELDECILTCDFGFISSGKLEFACLDEELSQARCVQPMAVLVGGESGLANALSSVELVSVNETLRNMSMADFPYDIVAPMVFWTEGHLMVCGGRRTEFREKVYESRCWMYQPCGNIWEESIEMTQPRSNGVGLIDTRGKPIIFGGINQNETTQSTELWNTTSHETFWIEGPILEERKAGHCGLVGKGGQRAILTAGHPSYLSQESFEPSEDIHEFVLNLIHKRWYHACGSYKNIWGEHYIVAGGYNENYLAIDTVEVWNPLLHYWSEGPSLPEARGGGGMVILEGLPTILGGKALFPKTSAMKLDITADKWDFWDFEIKQARLYPGIASVPETMFDHC
eukprot:maker-scaffold899_size83673-snap-gene-0.14 protein:Tk06725 transcript:maker-scaffold899_size83673-snap-gene-0.14-mRNA-1 annotation:"hypothetical protein SINV_02028"